MKLVNDKGEAVYHGLPSVLAILNFFHPRHKYLGLGSAPLQGHIGVLHQARLLARRPAGHVALAVLDGIGGDIRCGYFVKSSLLRVVQEYLVVIFFVGINDLCHFVHLQSIKSHPASSG